MKRISDKINFLTNTSVDQPEQAAIPVPSASLFPQASQSFQHHDTPSPNQVDTDENEIEFNEQNLPNLPADVKLAVEGGDSNTPPGFEEAKP